MHYAADEWECVTYIIYRVGVLGVKITCFSLKDESVFYHGAWPDRYENPQQ
ncbi:hypothetical protein DZS_49310 [Dickeya ananatis]